MKTLSEHIEENIFLTTDDIIAEGFWNTLGKIFGGINAYPSKISDELKDGYTTMMYTGAKAKKNDKTVEQEAEEQAKAAEQGDKELLEKTKAIVDRLDRDIKNINYSDYALAQCRLLKQLSDKLNDDDGKKQAEKFQKVIDNKWPKASDEVDKIEQRVKKSGVSDGGSEEADKEQEQTDDESNLGVTDDGEPAEVTPDQQEQGIEDQIKDDKEYLGKVVSHIGEVNSKISIDGNTLADYVNALITKSFKKVEKDKKTGKTVEKWNNAAISSIDNNSPNRLVDGISTVISGFLMLGTPQLNKLIIDIISPGDTKRFNQLVKEISKYKKEDSNTEENKD